MPIEVRKVESNEYDVAGAVTRKAYVEFAPEDLSTDPEWEEYLEKLADVRDRAGRTLVLVAVEDNRILGTATLELDQKVDPDREPLKPDEAHIRMLGVDPEARGRGAAKALMEACMETARQAGKSHITLHTTQPMVIAQRMYEKLGFDRLEDEVYPDGFVLLSYARSLD